MSAASLSLPGNREERIELLALLEEKRRRDATRQHLIQFESLYAWQTKFVAATADHTSCMLMAANRVGKTRTGLTIDAIHLLGDYPDDWEGHRFEAPPLCWLLGFSMEKTRDLLQAPLFGRAEGNKFIGGLIPADRVVDWKSATGTSGAMREVRVRHASGGIAIVQFWSYSQGQHAIMGDSVDWYHIDEEPRDKAIYPQVLTRTATGDGGKGGRGILTFTPENGRTELVVQFMDEPAEGQYMQRATWDDAPHLTEETRRKLLGMYPQWQRDMRSKGMPLLGTGLIFDFGDDLIKCAPFECPAHFWVVNGMDFGWDHPQAHVQLWIDIESDVVYLAHAWKKSKVTPITAWGSVKAWAQYVPTAWAADGLQSEKSSGIHQKAAYDDAGWQMMGTHATWPEGGVGVEAGLVELYERMTTGRFKVFSHLSDFFEEKMSYHRDETGKIVKLNDDLISATRYAYMMRRNALQRFQCKPAEAGVYKSDYDPFGGS
ncbi:terminase large subunit domain-containing protein [Pseudomonas segetis]|uniref:Terminase large (ATPase) subunit and inactivated derivatives n=1 Tax=Pseudomonas segetis TaxID=298908 RepID=A0A239C8U4_9PSED|nr:terminase family protein [Pseudomonas segetis]SNS16041.1 terminase large (ATPase) subunit and inactivated derivatives [Pseudomonas segetis]